MPEWVKDPDEREAYLRLALVPGIGTARLGALLAEFGSPTGALAAPLAQLSAVPGISRAAATALAGADRGPARRALAELTQCRGSLLLPDDPGFPPLLRVIPEPPTCLFLQGTIELLECPAVAIIGSRDHSLYGAEVGRAIARAAAEVGLAVVSGMARGLDAIAHGGALDARGGTIGVLGNGLGVIYPAANRELYRLVAERGLLVTEFPPGERPGAGSFPRRNRLISGLARVVIVVEAALTSGTLQTADCAHEQGREVLAVPGPVTSPVSVGTNRLIRDGAGPLLELADLLAHYPEVRGSIAQPAAVASQRADPLERKILNTLWAGSRRAEELVHASGASVSEALDALSALELRGRVRQEAGGTYRLVEAVLFA